MFLANNSVRLMLFDAEGVEASLYNWQVIIGSWWVLFEYLQQYVLLYNSLSLQFLANKLLYLSNGAR